MGEEVFYSEFSDEILPGKILPPWIKDKEPHKVMRITPDHKFAELSGISGVRIYLVRSYDVKRKVFSFTRIKGSDTPFYLVYFNRAEILEDEQIVRSGRWTRPTAQMLAEGQMSGSATVNYEKTNEIKEMGGRQGFYWTICLLGPALLH